jgi:hypothetical protein
MEEIWKDIKGYEGLYQVSNLGRVKTLKKKYSEGEKHRKIRLDRNGYLTVSLSKNGKQNTMKVHRLVAIAFIVNSENKPFVNHLDGVKNNNIVDNLEWVTASENVKHAFRIGLKNSKTISKVVIDLDTGFIYDSISHASKSSLYSTRHLNDMLNGVYANKTNLQYYNPTNQ